MGRREHILRHVDLRGGLGLEIGPLDKPIVMQSEGSVLYVDHASAVDLRAKYKGDPNVSADAIAPVDIIWGGGQLADALAGRGPVQWAIASHVMEHVPNPVGWLGQFAEVLVPGGILSLALPDGRFCFDAKRRTTDVAELITAALTQRVRPTLALAYDFWARRTTVDPSLVWAGAPESPEPHRETFALEKARALLSSDEYQDIHCSVFTPESFVMTFDALMNLDLVPWFVLRDLRPTERGDLEFFVAFERLPADISDEERRQRQAEGIASAGATLASADAPSEATGDEEPGRPLAVLSDRELKMVQLKRAALSALRRSLRRRLGQPPVQEES